MKKALSALILSATMTLSMSVSAQHYPGNDGGFSGGSYNDNSSVTRGGLFQIQLNQHFQGSNTLYLNQLLRIGPQLNGKRIEYIILKAQKSSGGSYNDPGSEYSYGNGHLGSNYGFSSMAQLLVNGMPDGIAQYIENFSGDTRFYISNSSGVFGADVRNLAIELTGDVLVSSIAVQFEGVGGMNDDTIPGYGFEQTVGVPVNMWKQGRSFLSVLDLLHLVPQYNGSMIKSVIVRARSQYGSADINLLVNNSAASMVQRVYSSSSAIAIPLTNSAYGMSNIIGQGLHALSIQFSGTVYVESVSVILIGNGMNNGGFDNDNGGYHGGNNGGFDNGNSYDRTLEVSIRHNLQGNSRVSLASLLGQDAYRFQNRRVSDVAIMARSTNGLATLSICDMSCRYAERVGESFSRIESNNLSSSLDQLQVAYRGNIEITRIMVTFE